MVDDDSFEWELLLMLLLRDRVISSQRTHKHINTIERARASWASRMRLHAIALGRWWWLTRISRNRDSYQLCIVRANARLDRTLHVATSKQHMSIEESPHSIMRLYYSLTTTYYESDRDKRGYVCVWIYIYMYNIQYFEREMMRERTPHTHPISYTYISYYWRSSIGLLRTFHSQWEPMNGNRNWSQPFCCVVLQLAHGWARMFIISSLSERM